MRTTTTNLIFILITLFFSANAQTLKTFSGPYNIDNSYNEGTAVYTYKEKDYKRTKHGNFKYNRKIRKNNYNQGDEEIKGSYKEGQIDGTWTHTTSAITNGIKVNCLAKATFKNGIPNGSFSYSLKASKGKQSFSITCSGAYKNAQLIGNFNYNNSEDKESIKANINTLGLVTGEYLVKSGIYEELSKADNMGKMMFYVSRTNGEVTKRIDIVERFEGLAKEDIFFDTLDYEINFDALTSTIWSDLGFKYLNKEGRFDLSVLKGPKWVRTNKKGELGKNNCRTYSELQEDLIFFETEHCIKVLYDKCLELDKKFEKEDFNKIRDKILSNEVVLRDSIVLINTTMKAHVSEYINSLIKLEEIVDSIQIDLTQKTTKYDEIISNFEKIKTTKLGDIELNKVQLSEELLKIMEVDKSYLNKIKSIEYIPSLDLMNIDEFCPAKLSILNSKTKIEEVKSLINELKITKESVIDINDILNDISVFKSNLTALNESFNFFTTLNQIISEEFSNRYKQAFNILIDGVNSHNYSKVLIEKIPEIEKFNNEIEKRIDKLSITNSQIESILKTSNIQKETENIYRNIFSTWWNKPETDYKKIISSLDNLVKFQEEILIEVGLFDKLDKEIRQKATENKFSEVISLKYVMIIDAWWLDEGNNSANISENIKSMVELQKKILKILQDKAQTKNIAKEVKKLDDTKKIKETIFSSIVSN